MVTITSPWEQSHHHGTNHTTTGTIEEPDWVTPSVSGPMAEWPNLNYGRSQDISQPVTITVHRAKCQGKKTFKCCCTSRIFG